jgi:hypothetical protein
VVDGALVLLTDTLVIAAAADGAKHSLIGVGALAA